VNTKLMRRIKRLQKLTGTGTFSSRLTGDLLRLVVDARCLPPEEVERIFGTTTTTVTTDPVTGYKITTVVFHYPSANDE